MAELTSAERIKRVLNRQEPDRVPHFEWLISKQLITAIHPDCKSHNEFAVRMGHDAVLVDPDYKQTQTGPTRWLSEWGYEKDYGEEEHGVEVMSPIQTAADFENYTPPDPHAPGRYDSIKKAVDTFKGDKAIGVHLNDVFSIPRYLMSMESLLMGIAAEPELVTALVDMSVSVNLALAKEVANLGVDFVWTGDDYAYNTSPLMSPNQFREYFYPGLTRFAQGLKELDLPFIKHTDGNILPILDMIIDSGISCLDPIDPSGGLELGAIKQQYGDRVALKGNVDCGQTLSYGTVEDTVTETKEVLRKGMPGGGFILSSSNSIHSAVKPENYLAMLDTLKKHGQY